MTATNITISNLTINVTRGQHNPMEAIASLLANATYIRADDSITGGETGESSEGNGMNDVQVAQPQTRSLAQIKGDIVEFLQPDARFSQRTWSAIQKKFSPPVATSLLARALGELVEEDVVQTKRRRADGETLYSTNVGAYVGLPQPDAQDVPSLKVSDIVEFLRSDERYTMRSFEAVRKHFQDEHIELLHAVIQMAKVAGEITETTSRSGVTYYSAR